MTSREEFKFSFGDSLVHRCTSEQLKWSLILLNFVRMLTKSIFIQSPALTLSFVNTVITLASNDDLSVVYGLAFHKIDGQWKEKLVHERMEVLLSVLITQL